MTNGGNPSKLSTVRMPPHFKMVFLVVVGLTMFFVIASMWLASLKNPTLLQEDLVGEFSFAWKLLLGAIAGLMGGKATGGT
jgi:hypothetical protein